MTDQLQDFMRRGLAAQKAVNELTRPAATCGCVSNFPGTRNGIVYCPLHAAASELLDACEAALLEMNGTALAVYGVLAPRRDVVEQQLEAAIKKARE